MLETRTSSVAAGAKESAKLRVDLLEAQSKANKLQKEVWLLLTKPRIVFQIAHVWLSESVQCWIRRWRSCAWSSSRARRASMSSPSCFPPTRRTSPNCASKRQRIAPNSRSQRSLLWPSCTRRIDIALCELRDRTSQLQFYNENRNSTNVVSEEGNRSSERGDHNPAQVSRRKGRASHQVPPWNSAECA